MWKNIILQFKISDLEDLQDVDKDEQRSRPRLRKYSRGKLKKFDEPNGPMQNQRGTCVVVSCVFR